MNGDVVNFRNAKKRVKTARKEALAAENRAKYGRSQAEKLADKAAVDKAASHIDGHKLGE